MDITFFKKIFTFILVLLISSCENKNNNPLDYQGLVIELSKSEDINSNQYFFPDNYKSYPIFSTKEISSIDYYNKLNKFKIPDVDTFLIATESFQYGTFFREIMLKDNYKRVSAFYKDSLQMFNDSIQDKLNILTGFRQKKQILIADLNNNQDFTDDPVLTFNRDGSLKDVDNYDEIDTLQILNFKYRLIFNGKYVSGIRRIQIYPDPNHKYNEYLSESLSRNLAVSIKLKDFWKGSIHIDDKIYEIALQGFNKDRMIIIIKQARFKFSQVDYEYNRSFYYKLGDSINLGDKLFKIDKIDNEISKIYLKEIKTNELYTNYRIGSNIEDFRVKKLNNEFSKLSKMNIKDKKFILLDFWGTWCQPCIKLTPKIKNIYRNNYEDLNIISIAFDDSIQKVKKYVSAHNLQWEQSFVNRNSREGIIRDLEIINYPTFILLDRNLKIIYRGSGENALFNITKILK